MKSDNKRTFRAESIKKKKPTRCVYPSYPSWEDKYKRLEPSVGNRSPFWTLFKQNPRGNIIFSSFCVLVQFFQLFPEHAQACPAAPLRCSPQGGCSPGEEEQRGPKRHKLQSAKLILLPFYRAGAFTSENCSFISKLGSSSVILKT